MYIKINGEKKIEIKEDFLTVKDKTLYNTKSKKREGLDGDIVSFTRKEGSKKILCRGIVDGYTCGDHIKLRGVNRAYEGVCDISFEHISVVIESDSIDFEERELLAAET